MADYFAPTVVQQTIPLADMTALERLVLLPHLTRNRMAMASTSSPIPAPAI